MPTEVVTIFSNMLDKYLRETDADHIAVIFDASGRSFRNELYDQYKANRRETPDDLAPQCEHVRQAADAFGVCQIEMDNFEADDLIATYARHAVEAGAKVTILSSDKDMMQLVHDGRVMMRDPMSDRPIGEAEVREKFGVGPDKVIEVQALCGDSTDNVPGVPGIGVKTAAELINAYGDLETLLARARRDQTAEAPAVADRQRGRWRACRRSWSSSTTTCRCPVRLSALRVKPYDPEKLFPFLDEMELRALKSRIERRLSIAPPTATAGPSEPVVPDIPPFTAERTYAVVDTEEGLAHWIEAAVQAGAVAIWAAPSAIAGSRPEFCGIALAVGPGLAAYVPLGHRAPPTGEEQPGLLEPAAQDRTESAALSPDAALTRLKPLLEDPGVLKIGHDMKGMAHLLRRHGIAVAPYDCTMLMSYVLDGGQVEHTIEELTTRALSHDLTPAKEVLGTGRNAICFAEVATAQGRDFACERADAALRLHTLLKARLVREHMTAFYETIERPMVQAVAAMEDAGVKVDRDALAELSRDFARRIAEIEQSIWRDVGNEFNIGSTKQLGDVLFEKLQLPGGKKGKTGAYGTDASILETLAPLHPVPAQVLEWRQLTKLKSTYADALGENIDADTGRVHTSFALAATATGRLSSSEPNIQNIPIRTEEGQKNPPRLCRRAGPCAAVGRLQPDRIASGGACRRYRRAETRLPRRGRYSRADRQRGVRRAARPHGPADPEARQGDQFRHPLRHQRVRPRQPDRRPAK